MSSETLHEPVKASGTAWLSDQDRANASMPTNQASGDECVYGSTYGCAAQVEPTGQLHLARQQVADPVAVGVQMQLEDPLQLGVAGDRR